MQDTAAGTRDDVLRDEVQVLVRIARRLTNGHASDADDLVQETFENALRGFERYEERGNLRGWLVRILHHRFLDRCRKSRRAPVTEHTDEIVAPPPDSTPLPTWLDITPQQLGMALDQIGEPFRVVYELHTAGRSYDEIASELGIAKTTVGTRLLRARRKLKAILLEDLAAA
ncbi:MAG TPA: RNA polymerase sigma factor [Kofleriaceae bacterium]|nr:RNA polymerase sigma factor [Kofleriaceae bacterium]